MEADWLRSRLESGRSVESIAHEAGKHPSTVGYWVNKHGLVSQHAPKHAARGPIAREALEAMLAEGLTVRAMAERLGRSYTSIRHWLAKHGLRRRGRRGWLRPQRRVRPERRPSRRPAPCTA
jgi:transposase